MKDDSSDATDMAQLAIFIRGTDDEYNVNEKMASLVPLKKERNQEIYTKQ